MKEMQNNQYDQLDASLRTLAATDEPREAAPRVEAVLLQIFRQQHAKKIVAPGAPPARASWFAQRRGSLWNWASFGLATAALLLIGFAWWNWRAVQVAPRQIELIAGQSPKPIPTVAPNHETAPTERIETPVTQLVTQRKNVQRRATPRVINVAEEEIATEFFPLVSENALPERGQMQRVKVPRSTLIHFGFPIDAERTEIPINADLLIGEDGGARAIRFVQDRFPAGNFTQNNYGRPISASYRNQR